MVSYLPERLLTQMFRKHLVSKSTLTSRSMNISILTMMSALHVENLSDREILAEIIGRQEEDSDEDEDENDDGEPILVQS